MDCRFLVALLCSMLLVAAFSLATPVAADQRLINGGFEQGTAGWFGNFTLGSCAGRAGTVAILAPRASVQQPVNPVGPGVYTLRASASTSGTNVSLQLRINWQPAQEQAPGDRFPLGPNFTPFQIQQTRPAGATSMTVIAYNPSDSTICVDDISLEGPPASAFVPVPTSTPSPAPPPVLPTPTQTATATPVISLAAATPAPPPPSATPIRTSTPVSTAVIATSTPVSSAAPATATAIVQVPVTPSVAASSTSTPAQAVGDASASASNAAISSAPTSATAAVSLTRTPDAVVVIALSPDATRIAEVCCVVERREALQAGVAEEDRRLPMPSADVLLLGALVGLACTGGTIYLSNRWRP